MRSCTGTSNHWYVSGNLAVTTLSALVFCVSVVSPVGIEINVTLSAGSIPTLNIYGSLIEIRNRADLLLKKTRDLKKVVCYSSFHDCLSSFSARYFVLAVGKSILGQPAGHRNDQNILTRLRHRMNTIEITICVIGAVVCLSLRQLYRITFQLLSASSSAS
jgi:hypothetical protein